MADGDVGADGRVTSVMSVSVIAPHTLTGLAPSAATRPLTVAEGELGSRPATSGVLRPRAVCHAFVRRSRPAPTGCFHRSVPGARSGWSTRSGMAAMRREDAAA
ncbi:hypothetical protein SGL43_07089 [Streptomyces globisporus]|uniref:Uncharacterized protein n=1 Tax=Streptomyces globisporus TaxID=1908 RepID=A0ABM9H8M9_STRGL|nr:hypothetical protein SGL43_07089 [Streptomyces globisporus]